VNCGGGAQANNTCTNFDFILMGKYWVNNNGWGVSSGSGQQCIWSNCQTGDLIGWGTSFNWTGGAGQVKTYASTVLGWHFGLKVPGSDTGLPVQISSTRAVNCGWDFTLNAAVAPTLDIAYDMFAHTINNPGCCDNPTDEIMVWLYRSGGAGPIGNTMATVNLGGTSWELHVGTNRTQNAAGWNVFSYVRTANATTSVLNMMDFMHDLQTRGLISGAKYLNSVQAGTEVFTGTGTLQTNGFYCRVQ
jgi:xyloglucan-specific endo-beta-1,4-glucanase